MNTALTFNKYCILKTNSERIVNNINLKTTITQTQSKLFFFIFFVDFFSKIFIMGYDCEGEG